LLALINNMSFQNASKDLFISKQFASLKLTGGKNVDLNPDSKGSLLKTGDLSVAGGVLIKKQLRVEDASLFQGNLAAPTIINTNFHGNTAILHNIIEKTTGSGIIITGNLLPSDDTFNLGSGNLLWNKIKVKDAYVYGNTHLYGNTTIDGNTVYNTDLTIDGNINMKCHVINNVEEINVNRITPKNNSINIGFNTTTTNTSKDIAIGTNTITVESIAIGFQATANDPDSIAIGHGSNTNESNCISMGFESCASGLNSIAIGKKTMSGTVMSPTPQTDTLIGATSGSIVTNVVKWQTFVIDTLTSLTSINWYIDIGSTQLFPITLSVYEGIGTGGELLDTQEFTNGSTGVPFYEVLYDNIILQPGSYTFAFTPGANPMLWQYTSTTSGSLPSFLNISAFAGTWLLTIFGSLVADKTIAIGAGANTFSGNSIALGTNSCVSQGNAIAIGLTSHANGIDSMALGKNTETQGANAIALGSGAISNGDDSVAILSSVASGTATAKVWGQIFQQKDWNDGNLGLMNWVISKNHHQEI
jgi:hypothetical protein